MKTVLPIVIALVVGFGGGYLVFNNPTTVESNTNDAMVHHDDTMENMDAHAHDPMEVSADAPQPSVSLTLHKDPKGGYNAQVTTQNITFAPENASTAHVAGEGHAHIYVNGVKINRIYGEWYHLADVKPGDVVSVQLSSNDHKEFTVDGEVIADTTTAE